MEEKPPFILLVEDNLDHAELVRRCLQDQGLADALVHLCDGEDALDYLFRRGRFAGLAACPRPRLLLLDLRLPRLDGGEVLRHLKATPDLQDIPVVILSSAPLGADEAGASGRPADGYLVKPLDSAQFVRLLDTIVPAWRAWTVPPP